MHWELRIVDPVSGIKTDPYYYPFQDAFVEAAIERGFSIQEEVVPKFVPIEHSASQPRLRLRKSHQQWPVVQIGPGVLTGNMAPPYNGWSEFSSFLEVQINRLFEIYERAGQSISILKLHLRYIDGFGEKFHFQSFPAFAQEMLGVSYPLDKKFLKAHLCDETEFEFVLDIAYKCKTPSHSMGRLKLSPGQVNNKDALIMETFCEIINADRIKKPNQIKDWFHQAHGTLSDQFHTLATSELKTLMSQKPDFEREANSK